MNRITAKAAIKRHNLVSPYSSETTALDALRARRVLARVNVSDALARELGEMAFASVDRWGARA